MGNGGGFDSEGQRYKSMPAARKFPSRLAHKTDDTRVDINA